MKNTQSATDQFELVVDTLKRLVSNYSGKDNEKEAALFRAKNVLDFINSEVTLARQIDLMIASMKPTEMVSSKILNLIANRLEVEIERDAGPSIGSYYTMPPAEWLRLKATETGTSGFKAS